MDKYPDYRVTYDTQAATDPLANRSFAYRAAWIMLIVSMPLILFSCVVEIMSEPFVWAMLLLKMLLLGAALCAPLIVLLRKSWWRSEVVIPLAFAVWAIFIFAWVF